MNTRIPLLRRTLRTGLLAAGMAAVIGTAALAPAMADEDDWHHGDGDRHEQVWRDHDHDRDRDRDRAYAYAAPGYAYSPAPAYGYSYAPAPSYGYSYAPAPTYAAPGLSLGFVFR
ncbi:MAG TPA: hypothetical protein VN668_11350 [Stellaceae bacterium]|nr:hypothetical protein [Stellaceae bacterium]